MISHFTTIRTAATRPGRLTPGSILGSSRASSSLPRLAQVSTSAREVGHEQCMPYLGTRISTPIHHAPDRDPAPSLAGMSIATDRPSSTPTTGSLTKDVISPPPRLSEDQKDEFWRKTRVWADTPAKDFMSYRWSVANTVEEGPKLLEFLKAVLPDHVPYDRSSSRSQDRDEFIQDVLEGMISATMAIRITPYILSRINWESPRTDPLFRQFVTLKSTMLPDHPKLKLDSLHEEDDSPVKGLVHRYPDKALFLATSVCPANCTFCTRSYAIGANTQTVTKASLKPTRKRWEQVFAYIESQPGLQDIVVSGGDAYYLAPEHIVMIGERLINMPNIRRFRFASKGLAVAPSRILDSSDCWVDALIHVSNMAKKAGKGMALHTHFNHPNEISWITRLASQKLFEAGVTVRNQTVLLRDVNDDVETMSRLIRDLADNNISPYYVYICDMVKKAEHHRTPLQKMLDLEAQIRGSIAGFMMPQFVVDLPGGGGKRLACSYESYDRETGVSRYRAPAVNGREGREQDRIYEYYDPVRSVGGAGESEVREVESPPATSPSTQEAGRFL